MNITFHDSELASFIGKVEKWHEDKFDFVVIKMFENFDPRDFHSCHMLEVNKIAIAERAREFIARYQKEFEKSNPKPKWKDFL